MMQFARLTVVLAVVLAAHCIEAEICSKEYDVFHDIALSFLTQRQLD